MITFSNSGEGWSVSRLGVLKRLRRRLVWVGGWEKPNGWGWQPVAYGRLQSPTPIALLNHRVAIQSFGIHIRAFGTYWCFMKDGRAYGSRNATPWDAHIWLRKPPKKVLHEAEEWEANTMPRWVQ